MANIDYSAISASCDKVARNCTHIANTLHGSTWLFDKLVRYFSKCPAARAVTIPVTINMVGPGFATLGRDGSLVLQREETFSE